MQLGIEWTAALAAPSSGKLDLYPVRLGAMGTQALRAGDFLRRERVHFQGVRPQVAALAW